jgi:phosphopantetheinyl transferase
VIVARAACGIDVETMRPVAAERIARRYFAPAETLWLGRLPEAARQHAFFRLWTLKEAAAKALGQGLAGNLARLAFDVSGPAPLWRAEAHGLALFQHDGDGFVLAAAVAAPDAAWQRRELTAAELCGTPPRPA